MFKTALYAATFVGLMGATAMAQTTDPTIQKIFDGLVAEGYTKVEIRKTMNGYKVEATNAEGKTERRYRADGSERKREDVRYTSDGGVQIVETSDGQYDDNSDDSHDDDHDGYDDGDSHDSNDDHGDDHKSDRNDDHGDDHKSDRKDDRNDDDNNDDDHNDDSNDD